MEKQVETSGKAGEKGEEKLPKMCSFFAYGLRRHSADQLHSAMCIINEDYKRIEARQMGT